MTAVLVNFRFNNTNFHPVTTSSYQCQYEARVDMPLEDLDLSEAFMSVQNDFNLEVGDSVTICSYYDNTWKTLAQVGTVRIIGQERQPNGRKTKTIAAWVGEITNIDRDALKGVPLVSSKERKLTIKKEFGGGFLIQDERQNVIERFKTKGEAVDYVDRLNGIGG